MDKLTEILKVSNPKIVQNLAHIYLGKNVNVLLSTRKDKKYMVENPEGKIIHFGAIEYEDYTKHHDEKRKLLFQQRNKNWKYAKKWTPAYLSYYLLWT
jgi:hypothetical protein